MKILKATLLLMAFGVLFSCSEDDDPAPHIGTWTSTSFSSAGCEDAEDNIASDELGCFLQSEGGIEVKACTSNTLTLNEDLTYSNISVVTGTVVATGTVAYNETDTETGTYSVNNGVFTICDNETPTDCDITNFTISGNTMTITDTDIEDGCTQTITFVK